MPFYYFKAAIAGAAAAAKAAHNAKDTFKEISDTTGLTEAAQQASHFGGLAAKVPLGTLGAAWHAGVEGTSLAVGKVQGLAKFFEEDFEEGDYDSRDYDILLSAVGAIELLLDARSIQIQKIVVPKGSAIVWKARVKQSDIAFAVKEIFDDDDPIEIKPPTKYPHNMLIKGKLAPRDHNRTIELMFDNSYANTERKSVAYWISVGPNASLADEAGDSAKAKEIAAAEEGPKD